MRRANLAEGERILQMGSPAHNHFQFHIYAIEASLKGGDWDEAERHAAALEAYTAAEPVFWTSFFAGCGRALAAHGRGARDEVLMTRLCELRDQASAIGLRYALPWLDKALAS